ncbi:MAG: dihydrodipicolinate synthase family protein, partial [Xanthomonadales bacterium]|nr:dihydrodipicolinate synthase family protein [Xanthomonadales bacterium]
MIGGSIVALVTPMLDDGSIDWDSMDSLLEMHIREGTGAIVSVGTT